MDDQMRARAKSELDRLTPLLDTLNARLAPPNAYDETLGCYHEFLRSRVDYLNAVVYRGETCLMSASDFCEGWEGRRYWFERLLEPAASDDEIDHQADETEERA